MKHLISLQVFLFFVFSGIAQSTFTEGIITYKIEASGLKPGDPTAAALKNAKVITYIKDDKMKMDMDMPTQKISIITDAKAKIATALMDIMGHKFAVDQTEKIKKEQEKKYEVKYLDETKEIAGYVCKKAAVKDEGETYYVYYAPDLAIPASHATGYFKDIKGFPMEYETTNQGIKMKYTVTSIEKKPVSDDLFVIPAGYKAVKEDQLQNELMKIYSGGQ